MRIVFAAGKITENHEIEGNGGGERCEKTEMPLPKEGKLHWD